MRASDCCDIDIWCLPLVNLAFQDPGRSTDRRSHVKVVFSLDGLRNASRHGILEMGQVVKAHSCYVYYVRRDTAGHIYQTTPCSRSELTARAPLTLVLTAHLLSRFNTKDDVSSSTSLKSSVQRHIRTGFCEQIPFLNLPAYSNAPKSEQQAPVEPTPEVKDEELEEEVTKSSGKGGKKKGGGKKGGKNKGGKEDVEEAPVEGGDDQQLAVIDEIWPKKDALGISKW